MGLDISVYKIIRKKDPDFRKDAYISLIDEEGNYVNNFPEWTKKFEYTVTENWYDWNKFKENTGFDINEYECIGETYSDEESFMEFITKEFAKTEPKYVNGDDNMEWKKWMDERENKIIKIHHKDIPTYKKKIKVLYKTEIGYQRKGLNSQFYKDYDKGKIGYYVWDKKELERYKQDYCNEPYEYIYPSGKGSGEIIDPKLDFQRNIIDRFVEGECCVTFDW